jgi:hypothetical protein
MIINIEKQKSKLPSRIKKEKAKTKTKIFFQKGTRTPSLLKVSSFFGEE